MPKRKASGHLEETYRRWAREIAPYHKFGFRVRGDVKLTPAQKSSITKRYKTLKPVVKIAKEPNTSLHFVPYGKARKQLSKQFNSGQRTNKGVWVRTPMARGDVKISKPKLNASGDVVFSVGNDTRVLTFLPDRIRLVATPGAELAELLKKYPGANAISLAVNGRPIGRNIQASQIRKNAADLDTWLIGDALAHQSYIDVEGEQVTYWQGYKRETGESVVSSFVLFFPNRKKAKVKKKTTKRRRKK